VRTVSNMYASMFLML